MVLSWSKANGEDLPAFARLCSRTRESSDAVRSLTTSATGWRQMMARSLSRWWSRSNSGTTGWVGRAAGPRGRPRTRLRLVALEDRLAPTVNLSIASPVSFAEGDSGTTNLIFMVTRSGDTAPALTVNYATQNGTALAGTDYIATNGTLSFAASQTTASIAVPIIGNTLLQS